MSKYECPNCNGGFPEPGQEKECPWCGTKMDKSYGEAGVAMVDELPMNTIRADTMLTGGNDE